jgi:hypothetical protein
VIHHIVLFTLTDPANAPEAIERLRAMRGQIPALRGLRCGLNSVDKLGASDIVLITEHDDEAGLREYAADPIHQELIGWLTPLVASRAVVDTDNLG